MSQLNVDNIQNRTGSNGGPNFPSGITVAVGQTAYIHGNLQVDGTETIINTETLNVADKTVGIGSTSNASNTTADGSGIEIFASSSQTGNNKTITWQNSSSAWTFGGGGIVATDSVVGSAVTSNASGIDVTGIITASSGVKVTGGGIDITGNIGLGGATYGSSGQVLTSGGSGANATWTSISAAPEITGTASGAIVADKPCIANADGTISQVTQTIIPATTTKQDTELSSLSSYEIQDAKWIGSDNFIMIARKHNDSEKSRYLFGSVTSGGAITLTNGATWTTDHSNAFNGRIAVDSSTNKFLAGVQLGGDSKYYIRAGQMNAGKTDIDWGTGQGINVGNSSQKCGTVATDNNGGYMIVYRRDSNNLHFRHCQLDSSNAITYSGESDWNYGNASNGASANAENTITMEYIPSVGAYWCVVYDSNRQYYSPNGIWISNGGYLRACWAKSNGTGSAPTMTQATQTPFTGPSANQSWPTGQLGYQPWLSYDSTSGKGILTYRSIPSSGKPCAMVLSFTDTTAQPTYTAAVELTQNTCESIRNSWNSTAQEAVFYMATTSGGDKNEIKCFTISGNTLSDANHNLTVFPSVHYQYFALASNPSKGRVITATKEEVDNYISVSTVDIPATTNNITAENFIGFAAASYADAATATIKVVGNTTTQSGLTPGQKYYVQLNATLATTPADISVEAGVALSSTSLLIK